MKILELDHHQKEAWNTFVRNHEHGTFFHLAEWKDVLEQAFGLKTFYLYAQEGDNIVGVLPLALVKRPLFGPALISTPLCVYGGALGERESLERAAAEKARTLGVRYLELRQQEKSGLDWPESSQFYTFKKLLPQNHEDALKAIPRKQRAEVRKGISHNLVTTSNHDIDTFYKIYATSVHGLGTPVFSKKYAETLIKTFQENCDITTIFKDDLPLTSVMTFYYKDQIIPYYGGGLPDARNYSAYPYMYWKLMEKGVDNNMAIFDFGRSMKGSGAFSFKKTFGFEAEALPYQYHLVKDKDIPCMDPSTSRNKLITNTWKKIPLPLANFIGPVLYPVIM